MDSGRSVSFLSLRSSELLGGLSQKCRCMDTVTRRRDRKIDGEIGRKRKANIEFSENSYTKKRRQRIKNITETEKIIERIKNSDRQAKARIRKSVKNSTIYLTAEKTIRKLFLEQTESYNMKVRYIMINIII
jgi:hypothetical protein